MFMLGGSKKKTKVVATFSPEDQVRVDEQLRVYEDQRKLLQMLGLSYRSLWVSLKEKYHLPDGFSYENETGEAFAPESRPKENR